MLSSSCLIDGWARHKFKKTKNHSKGGGEVAHRFGMRGGEGVGRVLGLTKAAVIECSLLQLCFIQQIFCRRRRVNMAKTIRSRAHNSEQKWLATNSALNSSHKHIIITTLRPDQIAFKEQTLYTHIIVQLSAKSTIYSGVCCYCSVF